MVEFEDGRSYEVIFEAVDSVKSYMDRLAKDENQNFTTTPGLILVQKVTLKHMRAVVQKLAKQGEFGFFSYIKEWDPEKERKYRERYESGMPFLNYEEATASEE